MIKIVNNIFLFIILLVIVFSSQMLNAQQPIAFTELKEYNKQKLLLVGDNYFDRNIDDSAMMCYSLIYNDNKQDKSVLDKRAICQGLNKASIIYYYHCDYKSSLELLFRALKLCEEIEYNEYIGKIYNNIGNVYFQFNDLISAKKYYLLAKQNLSDDYLSAAVINNLGLLAQDSNQLNSALTLYHKASSLIKIKLKDSIYNEPLINIGLTYKELKIYDSAFYYYRAAMKSVNKYPDSKRQEAIIFHNVGQLFFELKQYDSASYYLKKGNEIAKEYKLFKIMAGNYLFFSEIENARGNTKESYTYYKQYAEVKDSLFNAAKYSSLNELEFLYSMAKIDKQIQNLNTEQEIKERTIKMQRWLQIGLVVIILGVGLFLFLLYKKNKILNIAHTKLVDKALESVQFESVSKKLEESKYHTSKLTDGTKAELLMHIIEIMNNPADYCDVNFSLDILSEKLHSNTTYISQAINETFHKNFRTFLNEYRIKEACKIFANSENNKYSIEAIANMVGFKSKGTFNPVFKEVTGVTPSFYIESIQKKKLQVPNI